MKYYGKSLKFIIHIETVNMFFDSTINSWNNNETSKDFWFEWNSIKVKIYNKGGN